MLRRLVIFLLLCATPALAIETDCPLEDPENPGHRLNGANPRYGGGDAGEFATRVRRGDIWHTTDWAEKWQERNGKLVCGYRGPDGGGRDIVLDVPGLMIRCDWLAREVLRPQPVEPGTGGPIDQVYLRIWCTSRP